MEFKQQLEKKYGKVSIEKENEGSALKVCYWFMSQGTVSLSMREKDGYRILSVSYWDKETEEKGEQESNEDW